MAKRTLQQYGIKYPFTADSNNGYYVDTNMSIKSKLRSILMHVVFTPKGQKIRDPEFGTDLIRSIFEPNDSASWEKIETDVRNATTKYLPSVTLKSVEMLKNESEPHEVFVKISYSAMMNGTVQEDSIVTPV